MRIDPSIHSSRVTKTPLSSSPPMRSWRRNLCVASVSTPADGNSPQSPTLFRSGSTFTIKDADPHKYAVIMRYRQTMGEGTWDWATGGWSWYKKSLGTSLSGDLNLTQPGFDGECLNENEHEWGTYTYDFVVLEFENEVPANDDDWTQANALDWNFLKRYRDGYHLEVPEKVPGTDEPGHDVWTQVPEDSSAELRGYYCLESDWSETEEAQVERGQDVEIIAVDPELSEKSSTSGPGQVGDTGPEYGTEDADEDGKFDGLVLYAFQEDDPAGTWRAIFTAGDNGGMRSPQWRTHDALRMLTANQHPERLLADDYDQHLNPHTTLDEVAARYQRDNDYDARANGGAGAGFYVGALWADLLLYSYGHGSAGGGQISTSTKLICAQRPFPGEETFVYLEDYAMPHGLLAVWNHCHSNDTDDEGDQRFGCITQKTLDIGARCAVGFDGGGIPYSWEQGVYTPCPPAHWWTHYFWGHLCGAYGDPLGVTDAVEEAKELMNEVWDGYHNSDNARVRPEGYNEKIVPRLSN